MDSNPVKLLVIPPLYYWLESKKPEAALHKSRRRIGNMLSEGLFFDAWPAFVPIP